MKRYCIVPNTIDLTQFQGEYHYLDLGSIGTGAGAGYYALVLVDPRLRFPAEAVACFPHMLDSGSTLADASGPVADASAAPLATDASAPVADPSAPAPVALSRMQQIAPKLA